MVSNKKSKQLSYWEGKFGNEYSQRNNDLFSFQKRKSFFKSILKKTPNIYSILEVGCNIGGNLLILNEINPHLNLWAIEPNHYAAQQAKHTIPSAHIMEKNLLESNWKNHFDLVFTAGVLIHIGPTDFPLALQKIYHASKKYILTVEYYADEETKLKYRDLNDALFKRPFGKIWQINFPNLKLLKKGFLDKKQGFDECTFWLFKK